MSSTDENNNDSDDVGIMGKYYASKIGELREVNLLTDFLCMVPPSIVLICSR